MSNKKKGKRYSQEQILRILGKLKAGKSAEEICRVYGVGQSTLYRWKSKYGTWIGMNSIIYLNWRAKTVG